MTLERKIIEGKEYTCLVDSNGEIITIWGDPMKDKAEVEAKAIAAAIQKVIDANTPIEPPKRLICTDDTDYYNDIYDEDGTKIYVSGTRHYTEEFWNKNLKECCRRAAIQTELDKELNFFYRWKHRKEIRKENKEAKRVAKEMFK